MKRLLLALFLIILCMSLTKLQDSGSDTKIVSPAGSTTTLTTVLNANNPNVIPGAQWIWKNAGSGISSLGLVVFESLLYTSCIGDLTLSIAAYGSWRVYWDGNLLQSGTTWETATKITIKPTCGKHNLTIQVTKSVNDNKAGLLFLLEQDQTACYNCQANGFWNERTCKCECLTKSCTCPSNKKWTDYPSCACKCPPKTSITNIRNLQILNPKLNTAELTRLDTNLILAPLGGCPAGQYSDPVNCDCRCREQWCPPKYYWNSDPKLYGGCGCLQIIY